MSIGQPAPGDIIVARDRSGHFRSVQAAVDSTPDNSNIPIRIYIRGGKYFEKILVPRTKSNLHFIGENKANTILFFDDYAGRTLPGGGEVTTGTSYSVKIQGNDFFATNIRFQNSARPISQAVALHVVADRATFINCDIIGNQVISSNQKQNIIFKVKIGITGHDMRRYRRRSSFKTILQ